MNPLPLTVDEGGVVRVGKTRVTLDTLVAAFFDGATPEEIAQQCISGTGTQKQKLPDEKTKSCSIRPASAGSSEDKTILEWSATGASTSTPLMIFRSVPISDS